MHAVHRSNLHVRPHRRQIGLACRTRYTYQPGTAGIKLHSRILVIADVRAFVAVNRSPRRRQRTQRQRICRRAGRHKKDSTLGLENLLHG